MRPFKLQEAIAGAPIGTMIPRYIVAHTSGKQIVTNGITYATLEAAEAKAEGGKIFKLIEV